MHADQPRHLDLKKDRGLSVEWQDGTVSYYSIPYLRRMSPSADMVELRQQMQRNPLTVLPSKAGGGGAGRAVEPPSLTATDATLVGNYAIKITFSDGHSTGIYSWSYLREIDPEHESGEPPQGRDKQPKADRAASHANPLGLPTDRRRPPTD